MRPGGYDRRVFFVLASGSEPGRCARRARTDGKPGKFQADVHLCQADVLSADPGRVIK